MYPVLIIVLILIYISLQKFIYITLPALNSNSSKKKGNADYIIVMSDFVRSTEIVWLIVATCAVPSLLSLSLLTIFNDEILARWYATTVFMLKNLE